MRVIIHETHEQWRKERVHAHRIEPDNVNAKYIKLLESLDTTIMLLRCYLAGESHFIELIRMAFFVSMLNPEVPIKRGTT